MYACIYTQTKGTDMSMQPVALAGSPRGTVAYMSGWMTGRRGELKRRIISLTPRTKVNLVARVVVWDLVVTDHTDVHTSGDHDIIADKTLETLPDALDALMDAMRQAITDGYAVKFDLERVPRPTRPS